MPSQFHLKPLLDLSRNRMDDAASELGKLISREQEGADKLKMLKDYRAEYEARFMETAAQGIGVEALRNFNAFITRIDEAIEAQQQIVKRSQNATARGQQTWMHQRNRLKAFDTLHERHLAEQQRAELKQEQGLADEHAAIRFRRQHFDD